MGVRHHEAVRIGVVADTHLPRFGRALPVALRDGLAAARVDLILHLGDFTGPEVPALFEQIAPFDGVAGNNDGAELVERFGRQKVIDVGGARIGLTHGNLGVGRTTPERAARTFEPDGVDVVLFGHSHLPRIERLPDGRLLVNPGSPTDKRRQPHYTWALLEIAGGTAKAKVRWFADRGT